MPYFKSRFIRRFFRVLLVLFFLLLAGVLFFYYSVRVIPPAIYDTSALNQERKVVNDSFFTINKNWLAKNKYGLWEIYIEGEPFERGVFYGKLSQELNQKHESAFIDGLQEKVPSKFYLNVLKYFVAWFNRNLPEYIPLEYQKEIYGSSRSKSSKFDFIGPKYHRSLNYHSAHDVGHALQNMGLVGCTSLSGWGNASEDSSLIMGRNFDFYVGDGFAEQKMIGFINPASGYPFASISWPGMSGVVSGMNIHGLAVTLNAAPSDIPKGAKTPVAILARKIVQYAKTIDEAFQIADTTETFVSENIIISSAYDQKTVVIEKTPEKTVLFGPEDNRLICSNHFQHQILEQDKNNQKALNESSSMYRYQRMQELFEENAPLSVQEMASILRNTKGLNNQLLGIGNEMSINIQIAHHSVIFKPEQRKLWVAAMPSQLGAFICYDLNKIFKNPAPPFKRASVASEEYNIAVDSFLNSQAYLNFQHFRSLTETLNKAIEEKRPVSQSTLLQYQQLNPDHYGTYLTLGNYYQSVGKCRQAKEMYEEGIKKPIPWQEEKEAFEKGLRKCK